MSLAVVPVKRLSAGKSRLLPQLSREALETLSLEMLRDVLTALEATPSVERFAVVTPDPEVASCATAAGAIALLRADPGLNAAIDHAQQELDPGAQAPLLVVLGDVAGALPEDLECLYRVLAQDAQGHCVALAPSRDGGTSALLRSPCDAIPSCFGAESAKRHREAAAAAGVAFHELALPSLAIDLDRADDVAQFLASPSGGERTRRYLASLGWKEGSTPAP